MKRESFCVIVFSIFFISSFASLSSSSFAIRANFQERERKTLSYEFSLSWAPGETDPTVINNYEDYIFTSKKEIWNGRVYKREDNFMNLSYKFTQSGSLKNVSDLVVFLYHRGYTSYGYTGGDKLLPSPIEDNLTHFENFRGWAYAYREDELDYDKLVELHMGLFVGVKKTSDLTTTWEHSVSVDLEFTLDGAIEEGGLPPPSLFFTPITYELFIMVLLCLILLRRKLSGSSD